MKSAYVALGLLALGVTTASAQYAARPWNREEHRYDERNHDFCQRRAYQMWQMERDVRVGRSTHRERELLIAMRRDLDGRCGGFRWRG